MRRYIFSVLSSTVLLTSLFLLFSANLTLATEMSAYEDLSVESSLAAESGDEEHVIPRINDFYVEAVAAKKSRLPILVMFGADDCGYCEKLEAEILKPMVISGDYHDKVIIRKMMIDDFDSVRDFKGAELDASEFADKYHVTVTPTVMLLDSDGEMLAPKILGINTVEFYAAYLDQAIDVSYKSLNR